MEMGERPLDLDAVEAFARIAELDSFTRAAEAMRTTQAAVSLKLKRLEERLGCRLVERTPRHVQLSARGAAFLDHARELLAVHDRALAEFAGDRGAGAPGVDRAHERARPAAGDRNPHRILGRPASKLRPAGTRHGDRPPACRAERRGNSHARKIRLVRGAKLAASRRRAPAACDARRALRRACDGRAASRCGRRALDGNFHWRGVAAVVAAVMAGLGVAALAPRMLPFGAVDVGPKLGLPELPRLPVLLHTRVKDGRPRNALAALSAAFRSVVRD